MPLNTNQTTTIIRFGLINLMAYQLLMQYLILKFDSFVYVWL